MGPLRALSCVAGLRFTVYDTVAGAGAARLIATWSGDRRRQTGAMLHLALLAALCCGRAHGLAMPAATAQAQRVRVSHILVDSEEMAQTAVDTIK